MFYKCSSPHVYTSMEGIDDISTPFAGWILKKPVCVTSKSKPFGIFL